MIRMKTMRSLLVSILVAGCGNVIEPLGDGGVGQDTSESLPFSAGAFTPVTTVNGLLAQTFANHSAISRTLRMTGDEPVFEIAAMRLTTDGTPHTLEVELVASGGGFTRTLVTTSAVTSESDASFACFTNGVPSGIAACTKTPFESISTSSGGVLTQGRYSLIVVDEASGGPLACERVRPQSIRCEMPPLANRAYRVVVTGDGFGDLWDWSTEIFTDFNNLFEYTGGPILNAFYTLCSHREEQPPSVLCTRTQDHAVIRAIDAARIDFAPFELRLTTSSRTIITTSEPVVWDLGNDDLPGETY